MAELQEQQDASYPTIKQESMRIAAADSARESQLDEYKNETVYENACLKELVGKKDELKEKKEMVNHGWAQIVIFLLSCGAAFAYYGASQNPDVYITFFTLYLASAAAEFMLEKDSRWKSAEQNCGIVGAVVAIITWFFVGEKVITIGFDRFNDNVQGWFLIATFIANGIVCAVILVSKFGLLVNWQRNRNAVDKEVQQLNRKLSVKE